MLHVRDKNRECHERAWMACSSPTSIYLSGLSAYFISKLAYLQTRNICPICLTAKKIIFKLSTGIWIDTRPAFFIQHFEKTQGPKNWKLKGETVSQKLNNSRKNSRFCQSSQICGTKTGLCYNFSKISSQKLNILKDLSKKWRNLQVNCRNSWKLKANKLKTEGKNSRFRQNQKLSLPKIGRIKKASLDRRHTTAPTTLNSNVCIHNAVATSLIFNQFSAELLRKIYLSGH